MSKIRKELQANAESVFGVRKAEFETLVDYAVSEVSAPPEQFKRKPRFPVQTCLWLNRESIAIIEILTSLAKKRGQLGSFDKRQDYIRNLLLKEFLKVLQVGC